MYDATWHISLTKYLVKLLTLYTIIYQSNTIIPQLFYAV